MTERDVLPDDPRIAKLYAMLDGPETDIECLGNVLQTLRSWVMLNDQERAGTPGFYYIAACQERLAGVRQHLIDKESQ